MTRDVYCPECGAFVDTVGDDEQDFDQLECPLCEFIFTLSATEESEDDSDYDDEDDELMGIPDEEDLL